MNRLNKYTMYNSDNETTCRCADAAMAADIFCHVFLSGGTVPVEVSDGRWMTESLDGKNSYFFNVEYNGIESDAEMLEGR